MNKPTDAEIKDLYAQETGFTLDDSPAALLDFARAVLAKWGQPDGELIRQLVEVLESVDGAMPFPVARQVLKVARARMSPPAAEQRAYYVTPGGVDKGHLG